MIFHSRARGRARTMLLATALVAGSGDVVGDELRDDGRRGPRGPRPVIALVRVSPHRHPLRTSAATDYVVGTERLLGRDAPSS